MCGIIRKLLGLFCIGVAIVFAGCQRYPHSVKQVPAAPEHAATNLNYSDSTITLAAGTHYKRGTLHTLLYGKHYRKAWYTPVALKVLDIGTAQGGLKPLKMGGSRQTLSLRTSNPDGVEYVLRSVDKEPAGALSPRWQQSYVANIARDATSATHPYAALVLPGMASAIGIYHTDPEIVYVPHDPRLGEFVDNIGGTVVLMERRPDGNQKDNPNMGFAEKVKSTRSMLTERLTDNDNQVDARNYLRARLFDMLIGDWSRHEDNWRWAELEHAGKGHAYRPVPRDRDNVFYKLHDAPIPWFTRLLRFKPHFRTYRKHIPDLEKLNYNARNLDALILAELTQQDWQEIADSVQTALTDQVIEEAFKAMPDTIYELTAAPIISKVKYHRDKLPQIARKYYSILAEQALVVGSAKHEQFVLTPLNEDALQVQVYKTTKDGEVEQLLFDRTYYKSQTKELILYGLDGEDKFILTGEADSPIKISIWGGAGEDTYEAAGKKKKKGKHVCITDSTYGNRYEVSKSAKVRYDDNLRAKDFTAEGWMLRFYLE